MKQPVIVQGSVESSMQKSQENKASVNVQKNQLNFYDYLCLVSTKEKSTYG